MEGEEVEICVGVAEKGKRFNGVSRRKNRWRARVRHPIFKNDITVGSFSSPEEAAFAVAKKKAEFEEMFKLREGLSVDSSEDDLWGKKLPPCVSKRGKGRWSAKVWNPEMRHAVSLHTFGSPEEAAAAAVNEKRGEFRDMCGLEKGVGAECNGGDDGVEQLECGVLRTSECLDEGTTVKLPRGVRKVKSGKWVARIRDPESKARVWLGTFNTSDEAVAAFNKKKAVFDAKRNRVELDEKIGLMTEARFGSEALNDPEEPECEFRSECITSAFWSANLNRRAVNDTVNYGPVDDRPDKQQNKCVYSSPTSVLNSGFSNDGYGSEESQTREGIKKRLVFASNFDEAMSLGFINEYGQLLGKYCFVDEQMWLSLPDEHFYSYNGIEDEPTLCID